MNGKFGFQRRWLALTGLGTALMVVNLDLTILNLAIPVIGAEYDENLSTLQWINNVYSITFAALVIPAGTIADRIGHRTVFLIGTATFLIGSLVAGFAPSTGVIVLGRLVQGIGMAGTFGMIFVLVSHAFSAHQQGAAVGLLVVFAGVAQAIGPILGGFLVDHWGWRWAFLINVPFCLLSIVLVRVACRQDPGNRAVTLSGLSALVGIVSFYLMILAFNESQSWGTSNPRFLVTLFVGAALWAGLLYRQRRASVPLLDVGLYRHRLYLAVSLIRPPFQFCFAAFAFVMPLYLQNIRGYTPNECGLILLLMTLTLAIVSPVTGRLNDRFGPQVSIVLAHIAAVCGYVALAVEGADADWLLLSVGLVCIGVNVGMIYSATNFAALSAIPPDRKGLGFGMFTAYAFLFYSAGVAVAGYVLSTVSLADFHSLAAGVANIDTSSVANDQLARFLNGAHPIQALDELFPQNGKVAVSVGRRAFAAGFNAVMWLFAGVSAVGLVLCLLLRHTRNSTSSTQPSVASSRTSRMKHPLNAIPPTRDTGAEQ